ncbi:ribonuclease E activity regulator RraA [Aquimarina sp. D1M17]|uniref:ribonuclease E activity regulator RraA n=1 Tax=Aquimarina acroporae TaxID=2937283 RepID=UPI0020C160EB|nr:ribonuclease E activity regulator RraA [Aquimarina acroporae]MCK8521122.1 ribonuclease E activity regulator RraA [Aquimarina acroporae]
MTINTADLWDEFTEELTLLNLDLKHFGKKDSFFGEVVTLKLHEDNTYVRKVLEEPGEGKVLVVDGGGSRRCALVGDNIAKLAIDNKWEGIIVYGSIRDSKEINTMNIGIKALGTCPVKSIKRNVGLRGENLIIEGTNIANSQYIYADWDGVVLANRKLV